jgi:hypothetical protein
MNKRFQDFDISFYQLIVGYVETDQSRQFQKTVTVKAIQLTAADIQYLKVKECNAHSDP